MSDKFDVANAKAWLEKVHPKSVFTLPGACVTARDIQLAVNLIEAQAAEIERLRAMEQRLKSSFTRGTMDSPWLQRNALHLGAAAVAFMRWVWTGEEPQS